MAAAARAAAAPAESYFRGAIFFRQNLQCDSHRFDALIHNAQIEPTARCSGRFWAPSPLSAVHFSGQNAILGCCLYGWN
jgi:hypothetical protein